MYLFPQVTIGIPRNDLFKNYSFLIIVVSGQLACTSTNFTVYLPPTTKNRYQVRPHGAQSDFIEPLGDTLGL